MHLPIEDLTPREITALLDLYIVGQDAAKRAVAVALRNRYRRQQVPAAERDDILPKNILMMGPTGVGKTEIARRLAQLAKAPFIKVEATKFTEVGYVGRDVEAMVRDLAAASYRLVEAEKMAQVQDAARSAALESVAELLRDSEPETNPAPVAIPFDTDSALSYADEWEEREKRKAEIVEQLKRGERMDEQVEVSVEEGGSNFLQVFTPQGMEEMGIDGMPGLGNLTSGRSSSQTMSVFDAINTMTEQEAKGLVNKQAIGREAIWRAEQTGIIFIDEIDKVGGKSGGSGPDVSREGVQRDLLPIIEGSTVATKYGQVRTDHVLFIAAGAFHISKPSDLIPELQGRLPIRVQLDALVEDDFKRILTEPKNAITKQYQKLLAVEGVTIEFTVDALDEIAHFAWVVNSKIENIGARRLHTVLEKLLEDIAFQAPEIEQKHIVFDCAMVREILSPVMQDMEKAKAYL